MMPYCRSLKRRRCWLEIVFAGCVMLASPVQGAWPSFGTVWSSLLQHSLTPAHPAHLQAQHQSGNSNTHHGTEESPSRPPPSSLRGSTSTSRPPQTRRPSLDSSNNKKNNNKIIRRVLVEPAVEVEIALHPRTGDWEACSPKTCTQTRVVFCETREHRIVASDLCRDALGDALPDSERACVGIDIAAVCGDTAAARAAAVGGDGDNTAGEGGMGGSRPSTFASNANGGGSVGASGGSDAKSKGAAPPPSSATNPSGSSNNNGNGRDHGDGYRRGSKPAATSKKEETKPKPTTKVPVPAPPTKGAPAPNTASSGKDAGGSKEEGAEEAGGGADSTMPAPSTKQGETPSNPSSGKTTEPKPNLSAKGGQLNQMGAAGPRAHRLELRFWVVMAIGAGAVGSFMGVVVFAVGQYRKEQHRLRGIMALNEFPQDNYINPFAKQLSSDLSEHDRSTFKLSI